MGALADVAENPRGTSPVQILEIQPTITSLASTPTRVCSDESASHTVVGAIVLEEHSGGRRPSAKPPRRLVA